MQSIPPSCSKEADKFLKCPFCKGFSVKNGKSKSGKQRYVCKECNKYFVSYYTNHAYHININKAIIKHTKEGVGIRSTARLLEISPTTLLKRILQIADNINQPVISKNKVYEVDEMKSFIKRKKKKIWIAYALE